MLYVLICTDKPNGLDLRQKNRGDHLAWLAELGNRLKLAGPFTTPDGARPVGSLLVVEAESESEAQEMAGRDPYAIAGVFAAVDIRPWKWLIRNPEDA